MGAVLKAAVTLWCMLLTMVFVFCLMGSLLAILYGLGSDDNGAVWAGALGIFTFGWGIKRYAGRFIDRVEETKGTDRFKDWDNE